LIDDLLTVGEVAKLLRVPASWIYARTADAGLEEIPHLKLGRHLRFRRAEVEGWVERHHRGASSAGSELSAANPAHKIKLPSAESENVDDGESNSAGIPKPNEVVRVFGKLPPTYQVLIWMGAVTGLRRAELLGPFWNDIDFVRCTVQVRRSLQRLSKKLLSEGHFRGVERIENSGLALLGLKSKKARRTVEMSARLAKLLTELRQTQHVREAKFVFQDDLGRPLDPDQLYEVLHTAQDAAEVEHFGLHSLRHLYSSLLIDSGAPVKDAQARLGHASATTTLDIYAHAISEDGRKFSAAVESAFSSVSNLLAETNVGQGTREAAN
jgi:excisionase family DNA binding protein